MLGYIRRIISCVSGILSAVESDEYQLHYQAAESDVCQMHYQLCINCSIIAGFIMKKAVSILISAIMVVMLSMTSLAYSERTSAIPSVRLVVEADNLSLGDELGSDALSYISCTSNDYYYISDAVWLNDVTYLKVGDEPRMKVYLAAYPKENYFSNYSVTYLFTSSYTTSNVHVTKGTVESAARRDSGYMLEVTLRIKPVKGQYDPPSSVSWTGETGVAVWDSVENDSGYYDVYCYRGSSLVKKLVAYHGNSYNFYPYMTKEGEYTFKIRTVSPYTSSSSESYDSDSSSGTKSDWVESNSIIIDKTQVSDGTGQTTADEYGGNASIFTPAGNTSYPNGTGSDNVAGWTSQGGYMYFRYPNGEYVRDGWLKLNDVWYFFDAEGHRLYGWQEDKNHNWFYLDTTSGGMKTGWLRDGQYWYYLNTTKDSFEGAMISGWLEYNGKKYYFNESGIMVTGWYQINGNWYYFYPQGSTESLYGYMATNTKIGDFNIGADGTWR